MGMVKYDKKLEQILAQVKFIAKLSKMGDRMIIVVPKDYHEEAKALGKKQIKVILTDEL